MKYMEKLIYSTFRSTTTIIIMKAFLNQIQKKKIERQLKNINL